MAQKNGKLLVRLDERVKSHSEQIKEISSNVKDIKTLLTDKLTQRELDSQKNKTLIVEHCKESYRNDRKMIAWITIIVALVSVIVNVAFRV